MINDGLGSLFLLHFLTSKVGRLFSLEEVTLISKEGKTYLSTGTVRGIRSFRYGQLSSMYSIRTYTWLTKHLAHCRLTSPPDASA